MARSDEQIGEEDGFLVREIHDPTTHLYAFRLTRELEAVEVEKGGRDRGRCQLSFARCMSCAREAVNSSEDSRHSFVEYSTRASGRSISHPEPGADCRAFGSSRVDDKADALNRGALSRSLSRMRNVSPMCVEVRGISKRCEGESRNADIDNDDKPFVAPSSLN